MFHSSYVIQVDGNEIIVVIAIKSSIASYLGAIPVIVSSVLERHSLLVDTIVMVNKDQLPKKYNGEKLRKKVLSMYKRKEMYVVFVLVVPIFFLLNHLDRSAIHVSRIKNQHQPIALPKWSNFTNGSSSSLLRVDNSDNQSIISFSQRSQLNFDTNNAETASVNRSSAAAPVAAATAASTESYQS